MHLSISPVQVTSSFTSSDIQGYTLTDRFGLDAPSNDGLQVDTRSRKLVARGLPSGELYWLLPEAFIGNKVPADECNFSMEVK